MGISCDFEVGSMDSETKPTCNKGSLKLNNGQNTYDAVAEATTAKTPLTIAINSNDANNSTNVIDLVSPTPPEVDPILIGDDAEPEEGEIINTDSEFEYEAISSDEEFSLRQQIEALEAKNRELEKIASISSRTIDFNYIDDYHHRPSTYSNLKISSNRSNIIKTNPPLLPSTASNFKSTPLSHVECISSDEAQILDSENEIPPYATVFDGSSNSSKLYGHSHRSVSSSTKKEKRQSRRNRTRIIDNVGGGSGGDRERCAVHGKRRCTDIDCSIFELATMVSSRRKRGRHKYDSDRKIAKSKYSSDSEDELLRNREELKMALNIIEPSTRTANTTLSHKLSAIQNQHQQQQQHTLDDGRKSTTKHRKRKCSHSPPDRETSKRSKHTRSASASASAMPIDAKSSKRGSKNENDRKLSQKIKSSTASIVAKIKHENEKIDTQDDDDEHMSLEEQELRLIALKSAVLKKHEARKRKQMAIVQACEQIVRPYSPTDSIILVADETMTSGEQQCSNDCQIDSDNNNMDISPISSPTNQYQPMDMDLVSSNENSKSPIFSYEKPQTFPPFDSFIDWATVHIPVPINAAAAVAASGYVDIDQAAAACALDQQPFTLQPPYSLIYDANISKEPISVENPAALAIRQSKAKENEPNDNEAEELRAQLIEQMRSTNTTLPNDVDDVDDDDDDDDNGAKCMMIMALPTSGAENLITTKEGVSSGTSTVDLLEEDCLRSLLLSSKGKKSNILKETTNEPHVPLEHSTKSNRKVNESKSCDDIPKLTLNLREALKRLKSKSAANGSKKQKMLNISDSNRSLDITNEDENGNNHDKSLQSCDHNEYRKTVLNKRIDNVENELNNTVSPPSSVDCAGITDMPSVELKSADPVKGIKMQMENEANESAKKSTATAAVAKPSDFVPTVIEQKAATGISKGTAVASASKATAKLVNKKESTKMLANQSAAKLAAISKPKQKSTIESEPTTAATLPSRPNSSTPPTVASKANTSGTVTSTAMHLNRMESIRKSSGSPVITTWTAKPVKKLIISLNADSSSDTDDPECSTTKKVENENTNEPTFQARLDQFLQKVRANTNAAPEKRQTINSNATKATTTTTPTTKSVEKKGSTQNQTSSSSSSKLESSKAVAHLPISSQLEYHRLLNRMKLLEKQKEQKSRLKNQQQPTLPTVAETVPLPPVESNFANLTVVVKNENRIIQTNKALSMNDNDKESLDVMKVANKSPLIATSNTSLAKRVLLKNAIDSLNTQQVTNELDCSMDENNGKMSVAIITSTASAPKPTINELKPEPRPATVPISTITTTSDGKESATKSKTTAMSLAMFEKKAPKVQASVLANYVKRYRNQGEQYLCDLAKLHRLTSRTYLETRKQQKLEQALDELRRQTKIVEEKVTQQKTITQSLYPAMLAAEKTANTNRLTMQKLGNCCSRLGNIVNGADYKIQSEKESQIKNKIMQITIEKNKLKLLTQKTPITSQVPNNAAVKLPSKPQTTSLTKLSPSSSSSLTSLSSAAKQESNTQPVAPIKHQEKIPLPIPKQANALDRIGQKIEPENYVTENPNDCIKDDADEHRIDLKLNEMALPIQGKESNSCENQKEPIQNENSIEPKTDAAFTVKEFQANVEKENVQTIQANINNNEPSIVNSSCMSADSVNVAENEEVSANDAIGGETQCGKYDSPLDHLENCVEIPQPIVSDADRNAIVCPYDLMGRCEDKQCKYKHIKM